MILMLQRRAQQAHSTPGSLSVDGVYECFTLEPLAAGVEFPRIAAGGPWPVTLRPSPKFQVLARSDPWFQQYANAMPHIDYRPDSVTMIHPGNTPSETHDCILVGRVRGDDWLESSRAAFAALYSKISKGLASGCSMEIFDWPTNSEEVQDAVEGS